MTYICHAVLARDPTRQCVDSDTDFGMTSKPEHFTHLQSNIAHKIIHSILLPHLGINMKVPPADADKDKPKTIKGKEYFWCAKHTRWARHITSACQGKGLNKDPKANQEPPPSL